MSPFSGRRRLAQELVGETTVAGTPQQALAVSLDLDIELEVGAQHRIRAVDHGAGFRTSGTIASGEKVAWRGRLWGVVPFRHTSLIGAVVDDDGHGGAHFTDTMHSGLFRLFRHEHTYVPTSPGPDGERAP